MLFLHISSAVTTPSVNRIDLDLLHAPQFIREIQGITRLQSHSVCKQSLKISRSLCALSTLMHNNVALIMSVCRMHSSQSMQQQEPRFKTVLNSVQGGFMEGNDARAQRGTMGVIIDYIASHL